MLEFAKVDDIVKKIASATLKRTADADGREALRVTIVLKRGSGDQITGKMAVDTLVGVDQALQAADDNRFPYIHYVTEEELEARHDAEC